MFPETDALGKELLTDKIRLKRLESVLSGAAAPEPRAPAACGARGRRAGEGGGEWLITRRDVLDSGLQVWGVGCSGDVGPVDLGLGPTADAVRRGENARRVKRRELERLAGETRRATEKQTAHAACDLVLLRERELQKLRDSGELAYPRLATDLAALEREGIRRRSEQVQTDTAGSSQRRLRALYEQTARAVLSRTILTSEHPPPDDDSTAPGPHSNSQVAPCSDEPGSPDNVEPRHEPVFDTSSHGGDAPPVPPPDLPEVGPDARLDELSAIGGREEGGGVEFDEIELCSPPEPESRKSLANNIDEGDNANNNTDDNNKGNLSPMVSPTLSDRKLSFSSMPTGSVAVQQWSSSSVASHADTPDRKPAFAAGGVQGTAGNVPSAGGSGVGSATGVAHPNTPRLSVPAAADTRAHRDRSPYGGSRIGQAGNVTPQTATRYQPPVPQLTPSSQEATPALPASRPTPHVQEAASAGIIPAAQSSVLNQPRPSVFTATTVPREQGGSTGDTVAALHERLHGLLQACGDGGGPQWSSRESIVKEAGAAPPASPVKKQVSFAARQAPRRAAASDAGRGIRANQTERGTPSPQRSLPLGPAAPAASGSTVPAQCLPLKAPSPPRLGDPAIPYYQVAQERSVAQVAGPPGALGFFEAPCPSLETTSPPRLCLQQEGVSGSSSAQFQGQRGAGVDVQSHPHQVYTPSASLETTSPPRPRELCLQQEDPSSLSAQLQDHVYTPSATLETTSPPRPRGLRLQPGASSAQRAVGISGWQDHPSGLSVCECSGVEAGGGSEQLPPSSGSASAGEQSRPVFGGSEEGASGPRRGGAYPPGMNVAAECGHIHPGSGQAPRQPSSPHNGRRPRAVIGATSAEPADSPGPAACPQCAAAAAAADDGQPWLVTCPSCAATFSPAGLLRGSPAAILPPGGGGSHGRGSGALAVFEAVPPSGGLSGAYAPGGDRDQGSAPAVFEANPSWGEHRAVLEEKAVPPRRRPSGGRRGAADASFEVLCLRHLSQLAPGPSEALPAVPAAAAAQPPLPGTPFLQFTPPGGARRGEQPHPQPSDESARRHRCLLVSPLPTLPSSAAAAADYASENTPGKSPPPAAPGLPSFCERHSGSDRPEFLPPSWAGHQRTTPVPNVSNQRQLFRPGGDEKPAKSAIHTLATASPHGTPSHPEGSRPEGDVPWGRDAGAPFPPSWAAERTALEPASERPQPPGEDITANPAAHVIATASLHGNPSHPGGSRPEGDVPWGREAGARFPSSWAGERTASENAPNRPQPSQPGGEEIPAKPAMQTIAPDFLHGNPSSPGGSGRESAAPWGRDAGAPFPSSWAGGQSGMGGGAGAAAGDQSDHLAAVFGFLERAVTAQARPELVEVPDVCDEGVAGNMAPSPVERLRDEATPSKLAFSSADGSECERADEDCPSPAEET
ncbi:hypothetical protein DIPPA_27073 [Diplonema papillatum]|nr:hypothetical protein DIPPA_27073 [Diplonema papillatum]